MRKDVVVLRTSMKMLAAVLAAGAVLSACGQTRLGAAAVMQDQRISSETLTAEVSNLDQALRHYQGKVTLQFPAAQKPQQVLSWLIRFKVRDELAMRYGIRVTPGETQRALAQIQASASQGQTTAVPLAALAAANGLPPSQLSGLARYEAIQNAIVNRLDGGTAPTGNAAQQALGTKFLKVECRAAKALAIKVSPQFGRLNYNGYSVVSAPSTLAAAEPGATPSPSPSASASAKPQYSPAC